MSQADLPITLVRDRAAKLALLSTIGLTALKVFVGIISNSVGVLSEAIHSFLDVVSAAVAFITIREAGKQADEDHPFGHGKFETLSSLLESMLLLAAAGLIIHESIDHLQNPKPLEYAWVAIGTMAFSMIVSLYMYRNNRAAARAADSSAIMGNALHFLADVVAGGGILVGLLLIWATGYTWIDPILGFLVAAYIVAISIRQVRISIMELLDTTLPHGEVTRIQSLIDKFSHRIIDAHDLRTRKSGSTRHIDFHMSVCEHISVKDSHQICDDIEQEIHREFPHSSVNIHVEPCEHRKPNCEDACPITKRGGHS